MNKVLQSEMLKRKKGIYGKLCFIIPLISVFIAFLLCGPSLLESFSFNAMLTYSRLLSDENNDKETIHLEIFLTELSREIQDILKPTTIQFTLNISSSM